MRLKRVNREKLNELSLKAFQRKNAWKKILEQGQLVDCEIATANGDKVPGKRVQYTTLKILYKQMKAIAKFLENKAIKDQLPVLPTGEVSLEGPRALRVE